MLLLLKVKSVLMARNFLKKQSGGMRAKKEKEKKMKT